MQIETDNSNTVIEETQDLVDKYIADQRFTSQDSVKYGQDLLNLEGVKSIRKELDRQFDERKERYKNMNYSGEIVMFFFTTALIFIFLSFTNFRFDVPQFIFGLLIIIVVTFTNSSTFLIVSISKLISWARMKVFGRSSLSSRTQPRDPVLESLPLDVMLTVQWVDINVRH